MGDHSHPRRYEFWGDLAAMSVRPNRHTALLLALALFACNAEARAQAQSPPPVDEIGVSPPPPPPRPPTPFAIDPSKPQRPIAALTSVQPIYPRDQVCLGIDGTVTLIVAVGADNQVLDVTVERSSRSRELDRAAIDAVRRTRWQAQIVNGVPIASRVRLPVTYVLDEQPREYCRRVEITLFDTEAAAPVSARLELYVPVALQAELQWRRLAAPPQSEALVHEERRTVERSERERRSALDVATPRPLPPGRYALEVLIDGQPRGRQEFEVR